MSAHSGHTGSGAIFAALGANLGIAVLKFIAYLLTRSSSMLAEAIHSVADSGTKNGMTRTELRNGSGYRLRCL